MYRLESITKSNENGLSLEKREAHRIGFKGMKNNLEREIKSCNITIGQNRLIDLSFDNERQQANGLVTWYLLATATLS